jgi:hypothetical protein
MKEDFYISVPYYARILISQKSRVVDYQILLATALHMFTLLSNVLTKRKNYY